MISRIQKPGAQDYNGGQWGLYALKCDMDPAKHQNACSDLHLDLDNFVQADLLQYFAWSLTPTINNLDLVVLPGS